MGSSIYGFYAQAAYKAKDDIRRLKGKFTLFASLGEPPKDGESGSWEQWLVRVSSLDSVRNPAIAVHRRNGNDRQADNFESVREDEVNQYNDAVNKFQHSRIKLRELENTGEMFQAIENAEQGFRYILDEEAKKFYCLEQSTLQPGNLSGSDPANCETIFAGPKRIELIGEQTDAVRIQCHGAVVRDIEITDHRSYKQIGHRDGVQLIPPVLKRNNVVIADRMAGCIIDTITVDGCTIDAPEAELQGIFISDGLCRNLVITNNQIKTAAGHFISVAGALDGCKITNNILRQSSDALPQVKLYPGRLGGNMGDDGNMYILSFSADSDYRYAAIESHGNQYISSDQQLLTDQIADERDRIPVSQRRAALGLQNFDYDQYLLEYSQWRISDFKGNDPIGFRRLRAWLELRIKEYGTRERLEKDQANEAILPDPTDEQIHVVLPQLRKALTFMHAESPAFLATRIADLKILPIRSFMIKRLAIRHGEITLAEVNADDLLRRTAQLKWFLPDHLAVDDEPKPDPAVIPSNAEPQELARNFSTLKIMATPVDVPQGQVITFSVNEADYVSSGSTARYFWIVNGQRGNTAQFELNTQNLAVGEHNIRATLYVKQGSSGTVEQIPGSAMFMVTEPVTPSQPALVRPLRAFGDLKEHIRVNRAKLNSGQPLIISLDEAFTDAQQQGADLRYYWRMTGRSSGQQSEYEIDTNGFEPGEHIVWVTLHRYDLSTNKHEQFSGIAVVEVLGAGMPA